VATILLGGLLLREPLYARYLGALPVFLGCALVALASAWAAPPAATGAVVPIVAPVVPMPEGAVAAAAEAEVAQRRGVRRWWQRGVIEGAAGAAGGALAEEGLSAPLLGAPAEEEDGR
jgi:hypothetical protein